MTIGSEPLVPQLRDRGHFGLFTRVNNLTELFIPPTSTPAHMRDMLKRYSRNVREEVTKRFENGIIPQKGAFLLAPEPLRIVRAVAGVTTAFAVSEELQIPTSTEREKELIALGSVLVASVAEHDSRLRFIAPVCPDYAQGNSATFYKTIGEGVSPQAAAAIKAAQYIERTLRQYGYNPHVEIMVADTEDDIPEIMDRCVAGDSEVYKNRCRASVRAIQDKLQEAGSVAKVSTFTESLGEKFRETQYAYVNVIRRLRDTNPAIQREVIKLGEVRKERHAKILGRREEDYELTIRYMAQYAALSTLIRRTQGHSILLNYPTPNLPFYNAASYRDAQFSLMANDRHIIPIVETVL